VTATLETAARTSAASNDLLAEAFAEIAGLLTSRAHLPAVSHGTFRTATMDARPSVDLWFDDAGHVAAWAEDFGADVKEIAANDAPRPFTTTEAALPDRQTARLTLVHMRYHDERGY
jgi:hypothetical protein